MIQPGDRVRLTDATTSVSVVHFKAGDTFVVQSVIGEEKWLVVKPDSHCRHCGGDDVRLLTIQVEPLIEMPEP